jgi:hypothetical protein
MNIKKKKFLPSFTFVSGIISMKEAVPPFILLDPEKLWHLCYQLFIHNLY